MAELQSTNIVGTLSINGTEFSGGNDIKYAEFTASDTFTPTAAAISAGGIHQVFLVGGGERGPSSTEGGCGGEVIETFTALTSTTGITVTIGAGGTSNGADGGDSTFAGSSAGGIDIVAAGGAGGASPSIKTAGRGGKRAISTPSATVSVTTNPVTISVRGSGYRYGLAYQSAYAYAYQTAYAYASSAGSGYKGFGAGGAGGAGGIGTPKANTGSGSKTGVNAADGYCLVVWYES